MRSYKKLPPQERRVAVFVDMPEPLRRMAKTIDAKLRARARGVLLLAYDVGVLARTAHADEPRFGTICLIQLAEFLGIGDGPCLLLGWGELTRAFTREFLEQQVAVPMANGRYLELEHFLLLAYVHPFKKRMQLLNEIRQECLSPAAARKKMVARGSSMLGG